MKYYWEVGRMIMLGFAKREGFVDSCVKVEFLSQIYKYLLCYLCLPSSFLQNDRFHVIKYEDIMVINSNCSQNRYYSMTLQSVHIPIAYELVQEYIPHAAFTQSGETFLYLPHIDCVNGFLILKLQYFYVSLQKLYHEMSSKIFLYSRNI